MAMIEIKNLTKNYGQKNVFTDFNLNIEKGKTTVILGESGSGKTTLLNVLCGLTDYEGKVVGVPEKISYVFQRDRLIKNLTVEENLKLICPKADISRALKSVGLAGTEKEYPHNLSAGMSRRVAILRAFLYPSSLMIMDEPFINLDISKKYSLIEIVKKLKEADGRTIVCVTHDIKEAVLLADRIVVIANKNIVFDTEAITADTEKELFDVMIKENSDS